jgi:hypothetical protein
MRTRPAASCSGLSTGIAAMVVQLGFATMPLRTSSSACGLTSLTTSGTSGSIRQALELSTTTARAAANLGASSFEVPPPALKMAMSMPLGSAVAASSTTTSRPPTASVEPADRALANRRRPVQRQPALGEQAQHDGADLAGGADDGEGAHRPVPA